jgi:hypothetical protein
LHRNAYAGCHFHSGDEWLEFYKTIPDNDYGWMETHANEFALREPSVTLISRLG